MKKLFALMAIAAIMVACNDSADSTEKKDSTNVSTTVSPGTTTGDTSNLTRDTLNRDTLNRDSLR